MGILIQLLRGLVLAGALSRLLDRRCPPDDRDRRPPPDRDRRPPPDDRCPRR